VVGIAARLSEGIAGTVRAVIDALEVTDLTEGSRTG
jgi:hypothetical protein